MAATYEILVPGNSLEWSGGFLGFANLTLVTTSEGTLLFDTGHYINRGALVVALAARDMVETAARSHPLLAFRAIDLDKEPGLARDIGVHSYNTAVLQAEDRKVLVENVTDAARLGYAALRSRRSADYAHGRSWGANNRLMRRQRTAGTLRSR